MSEGRDDIEDRDGPEGSSTPEGSTPEGSSAPGGSSAREDVPVSPVEPAEGAVDAAPADGADRETSGPTTEPQDAAREDVPVSPVEPAEGAEEAAPDAGADREELPAPEPSHAPHEDVPVSPVEPAEGAPDAAPDDGADREEMPGPDTSGAAREDAPVSPVEPAEGADDAAPAAGADREDVDAPSALPETTIRPRPTVQRTVSQEIARRLHAAGARYCFTVPGESFLVLLEDLAHAGIRVIAARHEGGAAFMAEALAQSTGRPQLVAVTRAVGASNASIGIHTARQDSAPLIALVGQVQRSFMGREAFQETDLVHGIGALATWAAEIHSPERTTAVLDELWTRLNGGRPGPVLLSIPEDVQAMPVEVPDEAEGRPSGPRGPGVDRASVSRVLKLLASSERGVIVAGGGVLRARATKRLVALSEAMAVPVMAAWRRPDVFPNDHVNYLGMTGYWAAPTVKQRLMDADVIVFIGTRLSEVATFDYAIPAPETRWAHVDLAPRTAHAGLSAPTISVASDASRFLDSAWSDLRAAALDNEMRERRGARNAADREAYRTASEVGQGTWQGAGVHPGRVIDTLRAVLPDNAAVTTDAGNVGGWLARGFRFRRAGTFLGPTSGAMGFGLPAAIAASIHDPDRIAVSVSGDGGFAMTMMELETSVREGAHPIAVVLDDERYGTIAMHQVREGREPIGTRLGAVDFAAVARAHGAQGFSVDVDAEFEPALREAIASRQTSVIHAKVDSAWVSVDDNPIANSTFSR